MSQGKIEQVGTPAEVYDAPATAFVSQFVGETNRLPVTVAGGRVSYAGHVLDVAVGAAPDGAGELHFRPHQVAAKEGALSLHVDMVPPRGGGWRVKGTLVGSEWTIDLDLPTAPRVSQEIGVRITKGRIFDS